MVPGAGPVSMNEEDALACDATATGILHCLRMLAEEAAMLRLSRTLDALRDAIEACASEESVVLADGRMLH